MKTPLRSALDSIATAIESAIESGTINEHEAVGLDHILTWIELYFRDAIRGEDS